MKETIFIGTFTEEYGGIKDAPFGEGICQFEMDVDTLTAKLIHIYPDYVNPAYLALYGKQMYVVSEQNNTSEISVMKYDETEGIFKHQQSRTLSGAGSCHVTVWPGGTGVSVANYISGNVVAMPLDQSGLPGFPLYNFQYRGKGVNPKRQEGPHAHSTFTTPDGRYLLAADLGLDLIKQYRLKDGAVLEYSQADISIDGGEGPRHLCFTPDGRTLYVVTEMGNHVYRFAYDPETGSAVFKQKISTLADGAAVPEGGTTAAGIELSPDGRYLYVSNRGADTITVYTAGEEGGLTMVGSHDCGGKTPRSFCLSPGGTYLVAANQDSDNVVIWKRNPETGLLEEKIREFTVGKPVCVRIVRSDK